MKKLQEIKSHNEGQSSFKMGITQFTDFDKDERKRIFINKELKELMRNKKIQRKREGEEDGEELDKPDLVKVQELPSYSDVDAGNNYSACYDNSVDSKCGTIGYDQCSCVSCWAVGYTHFLQMAYADLTRAKGSVEYKLLSVQQILDCTTSCEGCSGGQAEYGVSSNQYVSFDKDYPYEDIKVPDNKRRLHECRTGKTTHQLKWHECTVLKM